MGVLRTLVMVGACAGLAPAVGAAESAVRPLGAYTFAVPGISAGPGAKAKALLWCHGVTLIGVVVPDDRAVDCGVGPQKHSSPAAFMVRDGRCAVDGDAVSFGFLVSRKAWVFGSAGRAPEERTVWLLNRFEGWLKAEQLKGVLVQVDVSHPGYPFQKKDVEAEATRADQASFADEATWHGSVSQAYCLSTSEP